MAPARWLGWRTAPWPTTTFASTRNRGAVKTSGRKADFVAKAPPDESKGWTFKRRPRKEAVVVARENPSGGVEISEHYRDVKPSDGDTVRESAIRAQLMAVGYQAPAGMAEMPHLASELVKSTLGKTGRTDEELVYRALQLAHHKGQIPELNYWVGNALRQIDPQIDKKLNDNRDDRYLRYIINREMGGSEKKRAFDFMHTGQDQLRSSAFELWWEGFQKGADEYGT